MSADVGPVLVGNADGRSVAAAIQDANPGCRLVDRGAYIRVQATSPCVVTTAQLADAWGRPFTLPGDLEALMPSFAGNLVLGRDEVRWE